MSLKNELRGKVRLIFQPAEEGCRGAKAIVENGWLDDVDYVIGNHMAGGRMEPDFDLIPGRSVAVGSATTKMDVEFSGKSAHAGSAPQAGRNALLAAASAVLNLNAIPRHGGLPGGVFLPYPRPEGLGGKRRLLYGTGSADTFLGRPGAFISFAGFGKMGFLS